MILTWLLEDYLMHDKLYFLIVELQPEGFYHPSFSALSIKNCLYDKMILNERREKLPKQEHGRKSENDNKRTEFLKSEI